MSQQTELITISNDEVASYASLSFEGEITVVDREELVGQACQDLMRHSIIGFDTETRPSFKAGVSYKVSLLQLSTPTRCYLFRINKVALSQPIIEILESEEVIKIGADVAGDIRSLKQLLPIEPRGFYDLQDSIWKWGIGEKSLRKMSALVLGKKISKAQRLSNWEAINLTPQQQLYAATDAWSCIKIYNRLHERPRLSREKIEIIEQQRREQALAAAAKKAAKEAAKEAEGNKRRYRRRPRRAGDVEIKK